MEYKITKKEAEKLKPIFQFISECSLESCALITNEILMLHPMLSFDVTGKRLISVESVSINAQAIQLNLEEYEE